MKELKSDKRFSNVKNRSKDITLLYKLVEKSVISKTNDQLCKLLKQNDIPHGVVNTVSDLKHDKHLKKVRFFRKVKEGVLDMGLYLPVRFHKGFVKLLKN